MGRPNKLVILTQRIVWALGFLVYTGEFLQFGARTLYRVNGHVQGGVMASRWKIGMWIGKDWAADEHIVASDEGQVTRARSEKACPENTYAGAGTQGRGDTQWDLAKRGRRRGNSRLRVDTRT